MLLGCIADHFTGATDLANNLVRGGMRTVQTIGVPRQPLADDVDAGAGQLIVAGGETAGAVVHALGVDALRIGPQIDPGVPWTAAVGSRQLLLALKSGNFGAPDFFNKAFAQLR
jgi:uncharacterized protein YgbK (DUF1537 family)